MKQIVLNTARVDNGGKRRQAGETISVGAGARSIDADTAADMVDRQLAAVVESPKKGSAKADEAAD